jgi:hypothetical protein
MSFIKLAGLMLSMLFTVSHTGSATSVDLFQDPIGKPLVGSSSGVNAKESSRTEATLTSANYISEVQADGVQFVSSLTETRAEDAKLSSTHAGESLGLATRPNVGSIKVSPRCLVPASDPSPSVAPESSTAFLFGLGLAALACVGLRQRRVLDHRD